MESALFELGFVFTIAAILGIAGARLKQPPILGYILTGIILVPFIGNIGVGEVINIFSSLGIAALLFLLGLELNVKELREVGKTALIVGISQICITFILAFGILRLIFGFPLLEAVFIAVAMTFSSTIVVVKLLGEKKETSSLYGRIAIGMLVIQDLFAIFALIILNTFANPDLLNNTNIWEELLKITVSGILLVGIAFVVGRLIERILEHVGKSTELLLLCVLAWFLMFAYIAKVTGFSVEVGAFLAGLVLSTSPLSAEIIAKIKPLRDFFIILFFINLGMELNLTDIGSNVGLIGALSLMVFIGNPLISMTLLGSMGFHRRVSFMTGVALSQISEFSIILVNTGVHLGQIDSRILTLITGVAIVTLTGSSYLIKGSDLLYNYFSDSLRIFERKKKLKGAMNTNKSKEKIILIGGHRMGAAVLEVYKQNNIDILTIDYDPVVVKNLTKNHIRAIYGDIADPDLLDPYDTDSIDVIISTVPEFDDNLSLLSKVREFTNRPLVITRANSIGEADILKQFGSNYVLIPEMVAGNAIVSILQQNGLLEKLSPKK